eukprot:GGOE01005023.1.p1 GENE.GGOE01005023.1~~GGOE01005023.1.p1  ORF type:complete len:654 (+),score=155.68 GGOE01005023.1:138-1964(+)
MWAGTMVAVMLMNAIGAAVFISTVHSVPYWTLFSVQVACSTAVMFLARSASIKVQHLRNALCLCHCLSLVAMGSQMYLMLAFHRLHSWDLPSVDSVTFDFIDGLMACLLISIFYIFQQVLALPFLQIGYCPASLITLSFGPTIYILMIAVRVPVYFGTFSLCPTSILVMGVQVYYCRRVAILRRSMFLLELQKTRHTREMQEADSVINHIVKNMMVEAAGLMDTFLDLCVPPPPRDLVQPYLHCALERLHNGMAWCKRRRALLELLNTEAKPHRTPTSLTALGKALVSRRTMTTDFVDLVVELDEALTDMMLENAINNAFRHGHPSDPDVRFFIAADMLDPASATCAVTFRITNRSDPGHQPLTPEMVDRLRRTDLVGLPPSTPLSKGLGLRHCFLAAELQGMTVSLTQEGDLVAFQASVLTQVVSGLPRPASPTHASACMAPLPFGLRISVIDDSASARTLLRHQLRHDIPGCIVDIYGASAADVEPFLSHTVASADVAILDQHLDWPSGSLGLGTDLVRLLLQASFRGLICIRSANMSEQDVQHYLSAGAHCVLDKLLDRTQTTATLAHHYWHFFSMSPVPPLPPAEPTTPVQPENCNLPGSVSLL